MLLKVLLQSISNFLLNLGFLISGHYASQSSPPEHQQLSPQSRISHQWSLCFSKFSSRASATFSSISDFSSVVIMLLKVLLQSISNFLLNLGFLISGHYASQSSPP